MKNELMKNELMNAAKRNEFLREFISKEFLKKELGIRSKKLLEIENKILEKKDPILLELFHKRKDGTISKNLEHSLSKMKENYND